MDMGIASRSARRKRMALAIGALASLFGFVALATWMSDSGDAAFPGVTGRIVYASGDTYSYSSAAIWSSNPDGGSPTLLAQGPNATAPSYAPNGRRIAFGREGGVAVMLEDGSGLTQLLDSGHSQSEQTKWVQNYDDPYSANIIPVVRVQTYTSEWHTFDHPAFSPDGSQLAVSETGREQFNRNICAVEALNDQSCLYGSGSYFNFEHGCNECGSHLIAIDSSTGSRVGALTSRVDDRRDTNPTYSVDGKLAFARSNQGSGPSIFVIDTPGASPRRVSFGQNDRAPDFSPDGSKIVFSHAYSDIGLIGVDGGAVQLLPLRPIPDGLGGYVNSPAFSPDGTQIAFRRGVYGWEGQNESGLFTMALDGTGFTRIAADGYAPSWQPLPPKRRAVGRARKGKIRLSRRGRAKVGTVTCGSSRCALKVTSAKLKVGKRSCRVRTRLARRLAPGQVAGLGVKVYGRCFALLKKAGKGRLVTRIRVIDGLGRKKLRLKATLVPPKASNEKRLQGK